MPRKFGNPIYTALVAMSIDGRIAAHAKQFTSWTSKEDKDFLHKHLDRSDVVVVGRNTYETAKKPLSKRNLIVVTRQVEKATQKKEGLVYFNLQRENIDKFVRKMGYKRVAVLGGQQIYTYFLEKKLLDEIYLTIEPVIFGKGLSMFKTKGFKLRRWKFVSIKKLNKKGSWVMRYARLVSRKQRVGSTTI